MKVTIEQLRTRLPEAPLLSIYEKVVLGTDGLTAAAKVAISEGEMSRLLTLCDKFDIHNPAAVIQGSLGMLFSQTQEDTVKTFWEATGLQIAVVGGKETYIEVRKF